MKNSLNALFAFLKPSKKDKAISCRKHYCRRVGIVLLIYISCLLSALASLRRQPEFESVSGDNGIPLSGITTLTLDDDGFVWAASRMGIMRATPSDCRRYNLPVSTSDVMQVKLAYNKGRLAASTQNGQIFRYNRVKDCFEQWFSLVDYLGNKDWVTNLLIDNEGKVWISTSIGIFIYSDNQLQRLRPNTTGYSYLTPLDKQHLFALMDKDIYKVDIRNRKMSKMSGEFAPFISSGVYDSFGNRVWLGTYQGELWSYRLDSGELQQMKEAYLPELIVRSILPLDSATLLVGMEGGGITIIEPSSGKSREVIKDNIDNPASLKGNSVFAMLTDAQGRLWTATTSGGLQYADIELNAVEHLVHQINDPSSLHNNEVNYLMSDRSGKLWVATNDGISLREKPDSPWKHYYGGRQLSFLSLTQDHTGRVYATTYGNGVYVLDGESGKELAHFTEKDDRIFGNGAFVFAAFTDSEGDVWFGGARGNIVCYSPSTNTFRKFESHPVFCFAEAYPGKILTGGGDGVIMIDKRNGKTETVMGENVVQNITVDGNIWWICTSGNGVIGLDRKTGNNIHLTTNEGLHSNFTRSLVKRDDKLWIGTALGLSCYDTTDRLMLPLPGKDLLTRMAFRENASCTLPDGKLAFGTNNGIVAFLPEKVTDIKSLGKIYFSDIRVSGRSIRDDMDATLTLPIDSLPELRLEYPRNSFTLSLLSLGNVSTNVVYSWKLEGQDKEWSELSPVPYINYVNLRPGKYKLHVKMYDGGMVSQRSLDVRVSPPFWATGWFRALIVLIVIGVCALLIRHYIWRMRRRYTYEKIRFFTRMAHDLRTSLMLIKAPLGELHKEEALSEWGEKCLATATEQTDRLTDTFAQLLDFEKADIGAEQPHFASVDLVALLKKRAAAYESLATSKGISFKAIFPVSSYTADVDMGMIERVVNNLLSNSVKYSSTGGAIIMSFKGDEKEWSLKVKDEGIGIPRAEQKKLFREFYRAENAVNSQVLGSGIGLLSVKRYVDVHSGSVSFESEEGRGTTFEIKLPRQIIKTAPVNSDSTAVEEVLPDVTREEPGVGDGKVIDNAMLVLVVEDNAALRDFLVRALQDRFKVAAVADGQEAWERIADMQPDLVLSDIMMPRMDGFELCKLIKTTYATSHIPVILLTAREDKESQMRGLELGADNYLVKPFDMELLAGRIASIIQNRRNVAKKTLDTNPDEEESPIVENGINDEFLKKAVECVKANITNEAFGKGDFASAMMISQSLLYKKIKALTDMSVVEFIRSIRLNYAMTLLKGGNYNVTEVSEMCGFSSSAYFSRVFKEHFGKSPSEVIPKA
ncbi:MAG: response regulator [Muribaculaceae bacterium]|nr:response regulator [Muribaculaceae bacterium]